MLSAARRMIARLVPVALACLWAIAGPAKEGAGQGIGTPAAPVTGDSVAGASAIERAFSERAGTRLRLFGHDLFAGVGTDGGGGGNPANGAVRGDQILGVGDELSVTVRGPKPLSGRFAVSNEGQLLLPDLPPINVAGRRLDDVRGELRRRFADSQLVADVFVYLTEVRRIGVWVLGAVARPGRFEMSPFATPLDALLLAGGVRPDGSLRAVSLHRRAEEGGRRTVDLYRLLLDPPAGSSDDGDDDPQPRLRDGDRLLVPPVGATVAVAGPVKRPGIYELAPERPDIALDALIALAGGVLRPSDHRALRLSIGVDGRENAATVSADDGAPLVNGDLVILSPRHEDRRGLVHLEGAVSRPGPRALSDARALLGLVTARDLEPDAYRDFAVVVTPSTGGSGGAPSLSALDLGGLLAGFGDRPLSDGERLVVLAAADIDYLTSDAVLSLMRGEPLSENPPPCAGLVALARALAADPVGPLANGRRARIAATLVGSRAACPPIYDAHPDLLVFALTHSILVRGGVPRPGFYPVVTDATRRRLERAAGGGDGVGGDGGGGAGPPGERGRSGDVMEVAGPWVELLGNVRHPGAVPLERAGRLRALLDGGRAFEPGTYPLMGVIERFSGPGRSRRLLAFSPADAAAGRVDPALEDRDRVHVFSAARVAAMMTEAGEGGGDAPIAKDAPPIPDGHLVEPPDPAIRAFMAERAVQVRGAVLRPASLPVAGGAAVAAVIEAAGGLTPSAEPSSIEVTFPNGAPARRLLSALDGETRRVTVAAGATIRVNPRVSAVEKGAVLISGEVRRPGHYDVLRGERLSSLIARAGGLTDEAYPTGAVFLRESAKRRERAAMDDRIRSLEVDIARMLSEGESAHRDEVAMARRLAAELRGVDPPGRIVVEADPVALLRHPDRDVLMEAGDRLMVPKRPLTVAVSGEVQSPGSFPFRSGKDASDYLDEAGGLTGRADADRAFVMFPDGRSTPLSVSSWNHRVTVIPPGSVVMVPADPRPYGGRELAQTLASILGQIAITAASISVISQ